MSFAWPASLAALLLLPMLIAGYLWRSRRRRPAVTVPSLDIIRAAAPRRSSWRRHAPFALVLAALASLILAAGRPQVRASVPVASSAIVVALDVSGSMCATDVDPNRLAAAQDAVRTFVEAQDSRTRIGLVVFAGSAQIAVAPTDEREPVIAAIDILTVGRGTAIGAAMLKSLDAVARIDPDVAAATRSGGPPGQGGKRAPEIVVLLTDGANTRGVTPTDAADQAAAAGVRVYPIGFGTTHPTSLACTPDQLGGDMFENPGRGRVGGQGVPRHFLVADEQTLRQVAEVTGGEYFAAADATSLQRVLTDLPLRVEVQRRTVEISVALAGLGALLLFLALAAAARWSAFPS